jgi:hypothetical protein
MSKLFPNRPPGTGLMTAVLLLMLIVLAVASPPLAALLGVSALVGLSFASNHLPRLRMHDLAGPAGGNRLYAPGSADAVHQRHRSWWRGSLLDLPGIRALPVPDNPVSRRGDFATA